MTAWYRDQARTILKKHATAQAANMGLSFGALRITGAQKRWGSCSSKGNLNFSFRIVMAPEEVIRYVVLHELCHLVEQNHSRRFWSLIESNMPEYRKHRTWLGDNGYRLTL
jgi:predicted metal-dependent hydrolase